MDKIKEKVKETAEEIKEDLEETSSKKIVRYMVYGFLALVLGLVSLSIYNSVTADPRSEAGTIVLTQPK